MSRLQSLSSILTAKYDLPKAEAEDFVTAMFDVIKERLVAEKQVKLKGLGTFKLTDVSSRESVDINTGQRIILEGRSKITFTPENAVRDRINAPFVQFESFDLEDAIDFSEIDEKYGEPVDVPTVVIAPAAKEESKSPAPVLPEEESVNESSETSENQENSETNENQEASDTPESPAPVEIADLALDPDILAYENSSSSAWLRWLLAIVLIILVATYAIFNPQIIAFISSSILTPA